MAQTGDSEPEQAIKIRLSIGLIVILYFCIPWGHDETFTHTFFSLPSLITLIFYLGAMAIAVAILLNPHPSPQRRIAGMFLDLGSLSILMYYAAEDSIFMYIIYLWVILGNGFRYGTSYLYISLLIGLVGFSCTISFSEYWQATQNRPIAFTLLFLMLVIPLYSAFLIDKLHAAIAAAKHANEAKSRFLANMSHELRTPLNGVIGIADLMGETKLSLQQRELVKIMRNSANTLLGLIENVLDISKIEAGKIVIAKESFDLHQLINTIIHMQHPMGAAKGIQVSFNIDPQTPFSLSGDPQHLRQVLINLIGNAIKFTDQGSVKLLVNTIDINQNNCKIRFEIIDTGIGIPEESLATIFDDFTQVTSTSRTVGGTGLGTTISKELVELMGGEIGVESKLGQGTLFWFELPFSLIPDTNLKLSDNHLLLLSTEQTHEEIKQQLINWNVEYDWVSTSARAFSHLMQAMETENEYKILVVDQACMLDIDPIQYAQMLRSEKLLDHLSMVLINTQGYSKQDPRLSNHYISIVHNTSQKPLLFNALHAAQSINLHNEKVVTLADHYAAQFNAKPLNILIAEDNLVNQKVLEGVLKHAGHETLLAETGEQALDILSEKMDNIDMLILDMNMPEVSGIEVVKTLRYLDTTARIPVIMLTADATPEAKQLSLDAGANAFLTKPINSRALLEQIAALLEQREVTLDTGSQTSSESTANSLFDQGVLSDLAELGGVDFIQTLVNGFKHDGQKHIARILDAAADDYLTYRESLHALKGSATELGASKLASLCQQGEQLKPQDIGSHNLHNITKQIQETFFNTLSALDRSYENLVAKQPK